MQRRSRKGLTTTEQVLPLSTQSHTIASKYGSIHFSFLVSLALLVVIAWSHWTRDQLPPIRTDPRMFSGESAMHHLANMTQTFHPYASQESLRISEYIVQTLVGARKKWLETEDGSSALRLDVFVDDHRLSPSRVGGTFTGGVNATLVNPEPRFPREPTLVHFESKNIYARLWRARQAMSREPRSAILVAAHLDSAVTSRGAFDDGVPIAIMLEMVETLLAKGKETERSLADADLVFLFGNGEELGLLDAHAYKQSRRFPETKAFVNMEAGGAGVREMLFRTSDTQMVDLYGHVAPYPHVNVIAGDIFRLGLIPSDTNFRVWGTEGGIPGVDFAFYEGRYYYHTPKDAYRFVDPRSVQRFGENMMELATALARTGGKAPPSEAFIYLDVLGRGYLSLSKTGYLLWLISLLVGAVWTFTRFKKDVVDELKHLTLAGALSIGATVVFGILSAWMNPAMVGARPWLTFFIVALITCLGQSVVAEGNRRRDFDTIVYALLLFWSVPVLLILLTPLVHFGGLYLFPVWATFALVASYLQHHCPLNPLSYFLVASAVPVALTWDVNVMISRSLATTVMEGKPGATVIGFYQLVCLVLGTSLWPAWSVVGAKKKGTPGFGIRTKTIATLTIVLLVLHLSLSPFTTETPARIFLHASQNATTSVSGGTSPVSSIALRTGHQPKYFANLVANELKQWKSDWNVHEVDCPSDVPKFRGLWTECWLTVEGLALFPTVKTPLRTSAGPWERKNGGGWKSNVQVEAPIQSELCMLEIKLVEPLGMRLRASFPESPEESVEHASSVIIRYFRSPKEDPSESRSWGFQLQLDVLAEDGREHDENCFISPSITIKTTCYVDDLDQHVPVVRQLLDRLPDTMIIMSAGAGTASIVQYAELK